MDGNINFTDMQRSRRQMKKRKAIRKWVNIVASIVLSISIIVTGIIGVYYANLEDGKLNLFGGLFKQENPFKSKNSGVEYILVVGLCPPEEGGMLTDTIIVACVDHENKTLNFLQIPRDLYIGNGDGSIYGGGKVNAVYASPRSGEKNIDALRRVINKYLGVPLDHYVTFTIPAFINLIDSLGGLEINITQPNGIDIMSYKTKKHHRVGPGKVKLNGSLATGFVRKRTGVSDGYLLGDADRVKAQQLAYIALAKKLKTMTLDQMVKVAKSCYGKITTDMSLKDIMGYATEVKDMKMEDMGVYAIPGQYCSYNGSSVYAVHKDEYIQLFNEHLNPNGQPIIESDILIYEWYRDMGEAYDPSDTVCGGTLAQLDKDRKQDQE